MSPRKAIHKMKTRWGVSTRRFWIIMIVFSLTGFSIVYCKKPLFHLLHVPADISLWIRIPLVLLMYQVLLLIWGTVLGEFRFFWEKEKKLGRLLMRPFMPRKATSE